MRSERNFLKTKNVTVNLLTWATLPHRKRERDKEKETQMGAPIMST